MTADLQSPPAELSKVPFYAATGNEVQVFETAARLGLPIMLKGPTGCGKTRLVEHMAGTLGVALFTVSCHEDMTAGDLLGRYVLTGGNTEWVDGPLTRAAREGGICYLDEIVEARQDATVAVHSLTDHRREISIERRGGEIVKAAPGFTLVCSYNPGYQSVLKDLKMSTRQRMVAIELDYPTLELERRIILREGGTERHLDELLRLGQALRRAKEAGLPEVASTRALVSASRLIAEGLSFYDAAQAAIALPLTDDRELSTQLSTLISSYV
jgi:nitric oxide reductase NorQ protein